MDSLTQIVLGAAVGTAVLGRKAGGVRAAVWGGLCGTLPDLDVLVPYGDPVRDFTFHRAESHSIFWLSVVAPALAWLMARIHRAADAAAGIRYRDWWLLAWLVLVTHAGLDAFTVYGTQLLLPFSDYPVGLGSVFIIDPLYTVPLLVGLTAALGWRHHEPARAARWNALGLGASTLYLAWTVAAQAHVLGQVNRSLAATPLADGRVLATPTPFNSLLWRVVIVDEGAYYEGHVSLFDGRDRVRLVRHDNPTHLLDAVADDWTVRRLAWFSKGFYGVRQARGDATQLVMTDLRMGQTPWFVFAFVVAEHDGARMVPVAPRQLAPERPPVTALAWLWRRILDADARPPAWSSSQTRET
jgi:inner membrane protein